MSKSLTQYPKDRDRNVRGAMHAAKSQQAKRRAGPHKNAGIVVGESGTPKKFAGANAAFDALDRAWKG